MFDGFQNSDIKIFKCKTVVRINLKIIAATRFYFFGQGVCLVEISSFEA